MSELSDLLSNAQELAERKGAREEAKVSYRDNIPYEITVPSAPEAHSPEEYNAIIADLGVPIPDGYELQLVEACKNMNAWTRDSQDQELAVTRPNWRYRFKVVQKTAIFQVTEFREYAKSLTRRAKVHEPKAKDRASVLFYADPQVGKAKHTGGGSTDTEQRVVNLFHQFTDYQKAQKATEIGFFDLGDACEGFQNTKSQSFTNDLSFPEQIRVARRLFMYGTDLLSRLTTRMTVGGVPSNHTQWRAGKDTLGTAGDDFGLDIVASVQDALMLNQDAYGHVSFKYPDRYREVLVANLAGTNVGMFHGHQANNQNSIPEYIKGQIAGRQGLSQADVFVYGHFHSALYRKILGNFDLLGCPSADNGSDWYTNLKGEWSQPGMLAATFDSTGLLDFEFLTNK